MASATLVQDSSAGNTCPVPFTFKDHEIRTVAIDDQPWFVAKDVCAALTIPWRGDTLASIQADWKGMRSFRTPSSGSRGGGTQRLAVIAEPAVYKLAFRSNKPEADAFTNWVASEVLPAIRKTGQFAPAPAGVLTPAQCRHLHDVLDAKVNALPKEHHRAAYAEAWTRFNRHFRIAKYAQLPQEQFSDALAYLIGMKIVAGSLGRVRRRRCLRAPGRAANCPPPARLTGWCPPSSSVARKCTRPWTTCGRRCTPTELRGATASSTWRSRSCATPATTSSPP